MFRYLALTLALLFPLPAMSDACNGENLIAQMDEGAREAMFTRAAATPYGTGLLWRATRGATEFTIFGTYHHAHSETGAHLRLLKPFIEQADKVYLEMTGEDYDTLQRAAATDISLLFITEGETLPDRLGEEQWQSYRAKMKQRGFPSFLAAKFKPIWGTMMLGISPCEMKRAQKKELGIDRRVAVTAKELGTPQKSLEDWRTVLGLFDHYGPKEQMVMLRQMIAYPVDPEDMSTTNLASYNNGLISVVWEFGRDLSTKYGGPTGAEDYAEFEKLLLTKRNIAWVDLLMSEPHDQKALIAVGAAHLPGNEGVLKLLEAEGFKIERLPIQH